MLLVTGPNGFVGHKIMEECKDVIPSPSLRNATQEDIFRLVEESGADTILHTAAMSDIGECAAHPEAAYHANVLIPLYLAKAAGGRKLICFSSDQVYAGLSEDGPYTEEQVKADNLYGEYKIEMEQRVLDILPDAVMLRAEWMYDHVAPKSNFFLNMLHANGPVGASKEQFRGVTYVREVAENVERLRLLPGGAYNFGSETTKNMYEISLDFLRFMGKDNPVIPEKAGHNLWMDCSKAAAYGVRFSTVEDGLKRCYNDYLRKED